jgi:hypothetical protein
MQNNDGVSQESRFIDQVRSNTKSDLIEITEDKLENILLKHLSKTSKTNSWITPLTLFLTILTIFLTADFKDFAGIEKATWKAVFLVALISSFIWSIITGIGAIKNSKKSSIAFLIKEIKNNIE